MYQNELYLVKFALSNDDFSVILWEKTLLDLAHLAGIKVPKSRLVALKNGQKALMIKRFDRINSARLPFFVGKVVAQPTRKFSARVLLHEPC